MTKINETGHSLNVANFEELTRVVISYGPDYNPSNPLITTSALTAKGVEGRNALQLVNTSFSDYDAVLGPRSTVYNVLNSLMPRIYSYILSTGTSEENIEHVRTIIRRIIGRRAIPIPKEEENANPEQRSEESEKIYISASHKSFESRQENFAVLIKLLESIPEYNPHEPELTVAELNNLLTDIDTKNKAVSVAYIALSNARTARNNILYLKNTGGIDLANKVKLYVRSVFGYKSPQFKQVSRIKFSRQTNR